MQSRANAVGYPYAWLGENIAFNYPDAPSVVNAWMNSPEHRANILNPNYTDIGVSFAWNSLGQAYATEDFGSRPLAVFTAGSLRAAVGLERQAATGRKMWIQPPF